MLYTAYRTYTELAAQTLSHLASISPESAQMHRILAQAQQSQDDFTGAIAQYRKALELDPMLPGLHFELAQAILAKSTDEPSRQEAEKELQQSLVEDPGDANGEYTEKLRGCVRILKKPLSIMRRLFVFSRTLWKRGWLWERP